MEKLLEMYLLPKIVRLGYSTRSTIEKHTHIFNLFFYFWLFDNFQLWYNLNGSLTVVVEAYSIYLTVDTTHENAQKIACKFSNRPLFFFRQEIEERERGSSIWGKGNKDREKMNNGTMSEWERERGWVETTPAQISASGPPSFF